MLSESLPPDRYTTTRFREERPLRHREIAEELRRREARVNAATPPRTKSRLVKLIRS